MAGKTQINRSINNATTINSNVNGSSNATVVNQSLKNSIKLAVGTRLNQKYEIVKKLNVQSGEAALYLCVYKSEYYVAKIYDRDSSIKPEIIETLKKINHPFIAKLYDTGSIGGKTFEILPYYKNGSLEGKKYKFESLKNSIIPALNIALKVLHDNNIIHKDLKPSNIMMRDDKRGAAIIDFGISSRKNDGVTMIVTNTGMTPIYSAPETFRNIYLDESDYYSLGITIYQLYTGNLPYEGFSQSDLERMVSVQRIPLPEDMPEQLKKLILGLTYSDISNRKNKKNPNRRWGYEEVKNWCDGIEQVVPGEGVSNNNIIPYEFLGEQYTDINKLVIALLSNWNAGKKQLFRGNLTAYFRNLKPEYAMICSDAEILSSKGNSDDDYNFFVTMYRLSPKNTKFMFLRLNYESLPALGRDLLDALNTDNNEFISDVEKALKLNIISTYLTLKKQDNKQQSILALEKSFIKRNNMLVRKRLLYELGYMLSGQRFFSINGETFVTVNELNEYMQLLFEESFESFQRFCHQLIDFNECLDPQFQAWLLINGKRDELIKWQANLKISDVVEDEL